MGGQFLAFRRMTSTPLQSSMQFRSGQIGRFCGVLNLTASCVANRIPTHPEVLPNPARLREGFNFIVIDPAKYNDGIERYGKLWREWVLQQ